MGNSTRAGIYALLITTLAFTNSMAQKTINIYSDGIPNSKAIANREEKTVSKDSSVRFGKISEPTLTVFEPENGKANGAAVLICPGGGYRIVSYTNEGTNIAKAFNDIGVTAFILKYRLPDDTAMINKTIAPLQDAQQSIKLIRDNAQKWNIDPNRVGVIGFSAGGHLAASLSVHADSSFISNPDNTKLRPDFSILGYAVISFTDSLTHKGSKQNLLGDNPTEEAVTYWSNELNVTTKTPKTFLFHAGDDKTVPVNNSIAYYEACLKNNVEAALLIYPHGGHGFGNNNKTTPDKWMDHVANWMRSNNWIK